MQKRAGLYLITGIVIFFSTFCCFTETVFAQKNEKILSDTVPSASGSADYSGNDIGAILTDTTLYIREIEIASDSILAWKKSPRYAYVAKLDSLLKLKEKEKLDIPAARNKESGSAFQKLLDSAIFQTILWALAIVIVLLIIYKLFTNKGVFQKTSADSNTNVIGDKESTSVISYDHDALIQQSYKLQDYRMAVRYLFLKTLFQLEKGGHIVSSADKTNYQYLQEIKPELKREFAALVLQFEYIWYGKLPIAREQFDEVEKGFTQFNSKI